MAENAEYQVCLGYAHVAPGENLVEAGLACARAEGRDFTIGIVGALGLGEDARYEAVGKR